MSNQSVQLWRAVAMCLGAAGLTLFTGGARADEDSTARAPLPPKYQQECAACHLAYRPGMLPAASWQRLMNGLDKHFGTDASLDAASVKGLAAWLTAYAGSDHRARREIATPPEDRITRTGWFVREHREVAARTWKRPAVGSAANCPACHARADQGVFDEDDVRIPR